MKKRHQQINDREIATSKSFVSFVIHTYGIPVRMMYNLRVRNTQKVFNLEPPYILLSNHVNTFDPILISLMHNRHIHWVAADTLFRNKYLRFLLRRLIGSISKSKAKSDYYTIQQITKSIRHGGIVGLFPEGQRTWDGRSLPPIYATAKLVRMLKVPIVICTLEGGYHSLPRWSSKRRRGKLTIAYQDPIMPEEFSGMSIQNIYEMLSDRLYYDAYEAQAKDKVLFSSTKRAEYAEHVLYVCPECGGSDTLRSCKNDLTCTACGYSAHMDKYGFFRYKEGVKGFSTVADWNSWQLMETTRRIKNGEWGLSDYFFPGDKARLFSGYRDRRMRVLGSVRVNMMREGIEVVRNSVKQIFYYDKIESLAVAMQRNLEFYYDGSMYRLHFPAPRASAYKYLAVFEAVHAIDI